MSEGERGFTLIETMAALAVAGLVAGAILSLSGQWFVTWKSAAGRMQAVDTTATLLLRLREEIGSALARPERNDAFRGNASSVSFFAVGAAGLEEVTWSSGDGSVRRAKRVDSIAAWQDADAGRVASLAFEYMGDGGEWRSEWRSRTLPRAVRITLHASTGSDPYVMVAPLRARDPALCARATSASTCDAMAAGQPVGLPQPTSPDRTETRGRRR